jgi:hypothetical protein
VSRHHLSRFLTNVSSTFLVHLPENGKLTETDERTNQ